MTKTNQARLTFFQKVEERKGTCITPYIKGSLKVYILCSNHHGFMTRPGDVKLGKWCPHCSFNNKERSKESFLNRVQLRGGQIMGEYINSTTKVKIRCKNNHEWTPMPVSINQGHWCSHCHGK